MKLLGADAAIHCSTAKRRRAFVLASVCAASTMPSSVRALSRYIAAVYAATPFSAHAFDAKRLSVAAKFAARLLFHSSAASETYAF